MHESNNIAWLERLRVEGLSAVEALYLSWREDFIAFAHKYAAPEADVLDAYQDAIIILYENVINEKLTNLTSSLKTYLFSVGKYTLLNKIKASQLVVAFEVDDTEESPLSAEEPVLDERQTAMFQALQGLGDRCQKIINLFYFEKQSIKSIVSLTGLKNENTVKAHKSRCLKSLREKMV
jgi:RNA polymerase sigma-70 factor (ECF subfamily)